MHAQRSRPPVFHACCQSLARLALSAVGSHRMKFQGVFKELGQFSRFSRRFKGLEQDLENSRRLKEIQGAYEPCNSIMPGTWQASHLSPGH